MSRLTVGITKVVSIESSYSSPEQEYTPISCQLILGLCFLKETMFKVFSLIIVISQFSLHQYIVSCVGLFCSTCHNLGRHSSPFFVSPRELAICTTEVGVMCHWPYLKHFRKALSGRFYPAPPCQMKIRLVDYLLQFWYRSLALWCPHTLSIAFFGEEVNFCICSKGNLHMLFVYHSGTMMHKEPFVEAYI